MKEHPSITNSPPAPTAPQAQGAVIVALGNGTQADQQLQEVLAFSPGAWSGWKGFPEQASRVRAEYRPEAFAGRITGYSRGWP